MTIRPLAARAAALAFAAAIAVAPSSAPAQSDGEIKQRIIRESIASYAGNCPCPYNTDRAGRRCGRRSAYSRPGGESPICYESDVSASQVRAYRQRQR